MKLVSLICCITLFYSLPTLAKTKKTVRETVANKTELKAIAPPKDNEACFSPDEPCVYKLIRFIQSAKETLDIAIFDITDKRVATAIIEQAKVARIRLVLNRRTKDSTGAYQMLRDAHILTRIGKQRGIMHNKITLVDGKRLQLGSYNYSYGASNSNQENQLYLANPTIVERYKARFEKMWREGKTR
jgi:cardiolipin hydrolase